MAITYNNEENERSISQQFDNQGKKIRLNKVSRCTYDDSIKNNGGDREENHDLDKERGLRLNDVRSLQADNRARYSARCNNQRNEK